ncbi:MAG: asparagine synthase (glutamine-hydrolyzing) [Candidatus Nitrohelix vancouverensis]|uniref:asparagine synthase (glutamine-hydrolyzing) n=1 Tax=Candidatus Nitrohelix vancouverensis TaxID=2705534 RepID=A0A7T0G3E8_9BACT|nr:MAG: asparagine synthase (glutamine-hydrolyzing) [Candidatus Nitrohelix vancouverensis]
MCGIFGVIQPDLSESPENLIQQLHTLIKHRGPDEQGHYAEPGCLIGNARLSIIDLDAGCQPIFNEDRSLAIVYNGELYNHRELRNQLIGKGHNFRTETDTETILHAFEEYGEQCVDRFNGMFAFAIWNLKNKSLFVARDRLGIKPLYIAPLHNGFAFASEAKVLLPLLKKPIRPNWSAIYRFFSFGYIPGSESPFDGIQKFPAGHYAWLKNGELTPTRFWAPEYGMGASQTPAVSQKKIQELIEHAVTLELMSDVPVGVFLSGGLDSSAVAVFAQKNSSRTIHSFALRFEESTHDESKDARVVADHLKLDHHEFLFSREELTHSLFEVAKILEAPFGDSTVLPLLTLSKHTRKSVKVVLTGWGGDEIFAGYPTYKAHLMASCYRKLPQFFREGLLAPLIQSLPVSDKYMSLEFKAKRFIKGMNLAPELQHFLWMGYLEDSAKQRLFMPSILNQSDQDTLAPVREILPKLPEKDLVSRIMHLDALFFLEGNGLFQADRMTMAASLEARVPLLNNDLIDYVNALPSSDKMPNGKTKELLRNVLRPHLPASIINKPKKGFGPPSANWTRNVFSKLFDDLFDKERVIEQGIFQFKEIDRMISEHRSRKVDHGRSLWALLSFQLWYNNFIEDFNRG